MNADRYSIAKTLSALGLSNADIAYTMVHSMGLNVPEVIETLASEDCTNLTIEEIVIALHDGLELTALDIAKSCRRFRGNPDFNDEIAHAMYYGLGLSTNEVVTALYSQDGLGLDADEVAKALRWGLSFPAFDVADVLHYCLGLSEAEIARVLYYGLKLSADKVAHLLYYAVSHRADEVVKVLYSQDGLGLDADEVAKAMKDDLQLRRGLQEAIAAGVFGNDNYHLLMDDNGEVKPKHKKMDEDDEFESDIPF